MNTAAPAVGLVGLPALADALTRAGYRVITGADYRTAATSIRAALAEEPPFPVLVSDSPWPGLRSWSDKLATQTTVVILRGADGKPDARYVTDAQVRLPATLAEILLPANLGIHESFAPLVLTADGALAAAGVVEAAAPAPAQPAIEEPVIQAFEAEPEPAPVFQAPAATVDEDPWGDEAPATTVAVATEPVSPVVEPEPAPVFQAPAVEAAEDPWGDETPEPAQQAVATEPVSPAVEPEPAPVFRAPAAPVAEEPLSEHEAREELASFRLDPSPERFEVPAAEPAAAEPEPPAYRGKRVARVEEEPPAAPAERPGRRALPVVEAPVVEEPVAFAAPVVEKPVVEAPVAFTAPVVEKPVVEAPVVEKPVVEAPVAFTAPVVEAPVVEKPVVEAPVAFTAPVVEAPVVEKPVVEAPVAFTAPVVEAPVAPPVAGALAVAPPVTVAPPVGVDLGEVIVSWAGKGGVGKTTAACALAQRAADAGLRVILVDGNFGQGDIRTVLRVSAGNLPSVYNYAVSGDLRSALIDPDTLTEARDIQQEPLRFAVVQAPPPHLCDPAVVTPEVYLRLVNEARALADLVVVDTQIIEPGVTDFSGMVTRFVDPLLSHGAWAVGITDVSSSGIKNLLVRLKATAAQGLAPDRQITFMNRVDPALVFHREGVARAFGEFSRYLGEVPAETAITEAMNQGRSPGGLGSLPPTLDAVLAQVRPDVEQFHLAPAPTGGGEQRARRGILGRRRGKR